MEEKKTSGLAIGMIAALLGVAVGYGASTLMASNMTPEASTTVATSTPDTNTKAAALRVTLNALEREHVNLAAAATRAGFDGDPTFTAAAAQLDQNSKDLQAAVASVYGEEAGKKFYDIWAGHITFFVNYTTGAKAGDKAKTDKAVADLGGYVDAISTFFSEANPNLPKDAVAMLVSEHVTLLKGAVDAHGAKNYTESYAKEHEANVQIGKIADALSGAIVKQSPAKFQ